MDSRRSPAGLRRPSRSAAERRAQAACARAGHPAPDHCVARPHEPPRRAALGDWGGPPARAGG
eukprot:3381015-Alexandrium_andersonii.AAC.1